MVTTQTKAQEKELNLPPLHDCHLNRQPHSTVSS
jgi:hypothetical protein